MSQLELAFPAVGATPLPSLPALPPLLRYYDDFARQDRTLRDLARDEWAIWTNGSEAKVRFDFYLPGVAGFVKCALVEALSKLSPTTTLNYYDVYKTLPEDLLGAIVQLTLTGSPNEFQRHWIVDFRDALDRHEAIAVRHLLRTACRLELGQWRKSDLTLVRALPGHYLDKYAGIRDGSAFLSTGARSRIVEFVDCVARDVQEGLKNPTRIRNAAILAVAFQYGLRTKQIASLEPHDLKFFSDGALHVRIELIKQRGAKTGRTVTRRIQQGWVGVFAAWLEIRPASWTKLFGLKPEQLGGEIQKLTKSLTGQPYGARDLRHTAAQRLVDGGASRESVSDFLGHTDTTAADVYFTSSPTQATLVNAALGYSPTYQAVAAAGRGDLITAIQLLKRPLDEQVSGMPHGIPVSGIGACTSGQSQCRRNPVLACYTCHKFLPVSDAALHRGVLEELRGVVRDFDQPAKLDRVSGAMMQLRATLEAIEAVVGETEEPS